MTIPPISIGIGALTPEVWGQMAYAANIAHEARGTAANTVGGGMPELGGHWSLAGTFLARLTAYEEIGIGRWAYSWTHFVPRVNSSEYFNRADQPWDTDPANPGDNETQNGEIVQPYCGLSGASGSYQHVIPTDGAPNYPAAYNLAEWNNTSSYANCVDISSDEWPEGLEVQPMLVADEEDTNPLVVMHWTRYCYVSASDQRSRVIFFFDRQNHFDGDCG